ncbi:glycosyltransferase family 39 protein [Staphylococcus sp. HKU1]|uniref:glycosyltransferase family 39 protein n=1 Tax=unclassified Staphylococcus TaxID=91994 RepID=UPI00203C5CEA|nr:glycosyltransferase family 39 protein [Staphylococcus sp. Marseille-Q6910]
MKYKKEILLILSIILFCIALIFGYLNLFVIIALNLMILIYLLLKRLDTRLIIIIVIQWVMYISALVVHKYVIPLPGSGNDDLRFERLALGYYNHLAYNMNVNVFQSSTAYSKFLSFFYYMGKPFEILPGFLNITVHTLCIILLYEIVMKVFKNKKVAIVTSFLFTIYPLTMINTVITLREVYVILFVLTFTLSILHFHEKNQLRYLISSLISILLGSVFHIGIIGLFIFIGIYFCFFSKQNIFIKAIILLMSVAMLFFFILNSDDSKIQTSLGKNT